MPRTVRRFDGFYEASGPFAVPKGTAETTYAAIVDLVGRHTGRIEFGVRGANIRVPDNPLGLERVRLGDAMHTALITKRDAKGEDGKPKPGRSVCYRNRRSNEIVESHMILTDRSLPGDFLGKDRLITGAHELAHTMGVAKHCALSVGACALQEKVTREQLHLDMAELMSNPFCGGCAENLEVAGYLALAQQL